MNLGWIKLHRQLRDHPRFRDAAWVQVWTWVLMSATHATVDMMFDGQRITLNPGQLITSVKTICRDTGQTPAVVRRILNTLEIDKQISKQTDNRRTLLSVTCWDQFQETDKQTNNQTTIKQQSNNNKQECKKERMKEQTVATTQPVGWSVAGGWDGITDGDRIEWAAAYPACDIDRQLAAMTQWLKSNPAKARKSNWRRFVTSWLTRTQDRGGDIASNKPSDRRSYASKHIL